MVHVIIKTPKEIVIGKKNESNKVLKYLTKSLTKKNLHGILDTSSKGLEKQQEKKLNKS